MPAVLVLLRERAWWLPARLDRLLPNVDVEGAKLEHRVTARDAVLVEEPASASLERIGRRVRDGRLEQPALDHERPAALDHVAQAI